MNRTGHRSVEIVRKYKRASIEMLKIVSNILVCVCFIYLFCYLFYYYFLINFEQFFFLKNLNICYIWIDFSKFCNRDFASVLVGWPIKSIDFARPCNMCRYHTTLNKHKHRMNHDTWPHIVILISPCRDVLENNMWLSLRVLMCLHRLVWLPGYSWNIVETIKIFNHFY